ncbi:MAG: GxxExxY protein [Acidobacteria bacterium]|nr:GxxExxY protein [Acidobacteriota bacterium]
MTENEIAHEIVDVAYRIHAQLGPGLFEKVYVAVMASQLEKRGLQVRREAIMPVVFDGIRYEMGYKADLLVEEKVVVEVKSVAATLAIHRRQVLTYLRLGGFRLGLLINFDVINIKDGIARVVNGLPEDGFTQKR